MSKKIKKAKKKQEVQNYVPSDISAVTAMNGQTWFLGRDGCIKILESIWLAGAVDVFYDDGKMVRICAVDMIFYDRVDIVYDSEPDEIC